MMLLQLGCYYAQGYGIAKPMPAIDLPDWIDSWDGQSIWHKLPEIMTEYQLNYDLHVAVFCHLQWLDTLKKYIFADSFNKTELPALSENNCQFSRWYAGIGKRRYGSHEMYPFIPPSHQKIHKLAQKIVDLVEDNKVNEATIEFDRLRHEGQEFISLLTKLQP